MFIQFDVFILKQVPFTTSHELFSKNRTQPTTANSWQASIHEGGGLFREKSSSISLWNRITLECGKGCQSKLILVKISRGIFMSLSAKIRKNMHEMEGKTTFSIYYHL